jgi:uncharacterized protein RhaS with RHS repeats
MGHRYYDTRIGRFLSQDPAGEGDNWYAYADNSPTNETDPFGLAPKQLADDPFDNGATAPPPDSTWIDSATGERVTTDANGVYLTSTSHVYIIHERAGDGGTTDADMGFAGAVDGFVTGGMFAAPPKGVPSDWNQIPHGPPDNDGVGLNGESRWINPGGTEGLEHHPGQPGNHDGEEHNHPLVPKPNGGWTYTNPKRTIIVGVTGAALAVGAWEAVKWGVAILAAPETFGGSLGVAAVVP